MKIGDYEIKRLDPLNIQVQKGYARTYFTSCSQACRWILNRNIGGDDLKALIDSVEASERAIIEAIKSATKDEVVDMARHGGVQ